MRKLWIFRGKAEFLFSVLAVSIPSYYAYTIYIESKFNNTIVDHSLNLLSKNPEIKQILGSPLHYKSSTGSDYKRQQNSAYYSFRVGGPKGNLPVELMASANNLAEIYHPAVLQPKFDEVEQLTNTLFSLKDQEQTNQTKEQISSLSAKVNTLKNEIYQKQRILYNRFYIVENDNMDKLIDKRENGETVPEDWKVWAITNLHMNLPNGNKIIVVPGEKYSVYSNDEVSKWTYSALHTKLNQMPENLSEEEIQEYNKQKSTNMYSKYNTHRLVTFLFLGFAAVGALWYKSKYTLSSIINTSLLYSVKSRFSTNPEVQRLGKYMMTNNIQGGRKGQIVDAKITVDGPKRSYVHILARYEDDGSYKSQKVQLVIEDNAGNIEKRINLK